MLGVTSLYANIPNHEGIETVTRALNSVSQKQIAAKVIITLLFSNNFTQQFYTQWDSLSAKIRIGMGTTFSKENLKKHSFIHP